MEQALVLTSIFIQFWIWKHNIVGNLIITVMSCQPNRDLKWSKKQNKSKLE